MERLLAEVAGNPDKLVYVKATPEGDLLVTSDKDSPVATSLGGFSSIYSPAMSTGNTSTPTAVANNTSWQSPVESVIDQMYAIPAIWADRAVTVTIRQFLDAAGTILQVDDIVISLVANQRIAKIQTLRGNYWSIQVANNSGAVANIRLDTYYVPQTPLPDSVGAKAAAESLSVALAIDDITPTTASIAAINVDLLTGVVNGWFDARAYHSATFEIVGAAGISAGQIIFEQTNDPTVTTGAAVWPVEESTSLTPTPQVAAFAIAANTRRMFGGPITAAYVRIRVSTAFAGGTVRAIPNFSQQPYARQVMTVHQAAGANLQVTVAAAIAQGVAAAIGAGGAGAWLVRSAAHRTTDITSAPYTTVGMTYGASIAVDGNVGAHAITTDVTAKSGTNPRLFVRLRGSFDNANWVTVYDSPVLTTEVAANKLAGHCPLIPIEFPWIQYGRDLRGTTPSVTHSVTRMTRPGVEGVRQRRLNDRVLSLVAAVNTRSTEFLYVAGCNRLQISCGAIAGMTTAAAVKVVVCEADPGVDANWIDLPGATLTLSQTARTLSAIFEIASPVQFARLAIATQGVGITADTYELALLSWET